MPSAFWNWPVNMIFVSASKSASLFSKAAKKEAGDIPACRAIWAVVVFS